MKSAPPHGPHPGGCDEPTLRDLLDRLASRDRRALAELHARLGERLAILLLALGLLPGQVEDVVADVLFDVWGRPDLVPTGSTVRCALAAMAYRRGLRALPSMPASHAGTPRGTGVSLPSLPLTHRAVFGLVYGVGCSSPEVARILGCPPASVAAHLRQVRLALRGRRREPAGDPTCLDYR